MKLPYKVVGTGVVLAATSALFVAAFNPFAVVTRPTIASLESLGQVSAQYPTIFVLQYGPAANKGGGYFVWSSTSTAFPDNCTIFAANGVSNGRYIRQLSASVTPFDCGAAGDGVTNDTAALDYTFAYAASGGQVNFPASTYLSSPGLTLATIASGNVNISGASTGNSRNPGHSGVGPVGATIKFTASGSGIGFEIIGGSGTQYYGTLSISGLTFDGSANTGISDLVEINGQPHIQLNSDAFVCAGRSYANGLHFTSDGIVFVGDSSVLNSEFETCHYALRLESPNQEGNVFSASGNVINDNAVGIEINATPVANAYGYNYSISGNNDFEGNGIDIQAYDFQGSIVGNYFENNTPSDTPSIDIESHGGPANKAIAISGNSLRRSLASAGDSQILIVANGVTVGQNWLYPGGITDRYSINCKSCTGYNITAPTGPNGIQPYPVRVNNTVHAADDRPIINKQPSSDQFNGATGNWTMPANLGVVGRITATAVQTLLADGRLPSTFLANSPGTSGPFADIGQIAWQAGNIKAADNDFTTMRFQDASGAPVAAMAEKTTDQAHHYAELHLYAQDSTGLRDALDITGSGIITSGAITANSLPAATPGSKALCLNGNSITVSSTNNCPR